MTVLLCPEVLDKSALISNGRPIFLRIIKHIITTVTVVISWRCFLTFYLSFRGIKLSKNSIEWVLFHFIPNSIICFFKTIKKQK